MINNEILQQEVVKFSQVSTPNLTISMKIVSESMWQEWIEKRKRFPAFRLKKNEKSIENSRTYYFLLWNKWKNILLGQGSYPPT